MLDINTILNSVSNSASMSVESFAICSIASIVLGLIISLCFSFKSRTSGGLAITIAMLPFLVQIVIMLVNGSVGAGVAVMGAFSLVRFRSAPGGAKEITSVFLAMSVGLATGMGYVGVAVIVTVVASFLNIFYTAIRFGENKNTRKELKITIPESLDYSGVFDDLFKQYTKRAELVKVRTTNMGSLYQLFYEIDLKNPNIEKEFIDAIRCRNGNLDIICGKVPFSKDEL